MFKTILNRAALRSTFYFSWNLASRRHLSKMAGEFGDWSPPNTEKAKPATKEIQNMVDQLKDDITGIVKLPSKQQQFTATEYRVNPMFVGTVSNYLIKVNAGDNGKFMHVFANKYTGLLPEGMPPVTPTLMRVIWQCSVDLPLQPF